MTRERTSTPAFDHGRFVVLFVTTRSSDRLNHILEAAKRIMQNPKRTLFLGVTLSAFLNHSTPLTEPLFLSPAGRRQSMISLSAGRECKVCCSKSTAAIETPPPVAA